MNHAERESIKDAIWLGAGFALIFALACLIGYELGVQHERRADRQVISMNHPRALDRGRWRSCIGTLDRGRLANVSEAPEDSNAKEITRTEFDDLTRRKQFSEGPWVSSFGDGPGEPYIPPQQRPVWGRLLTGETVCAK